MADSVPTDQTVNPVEINFSDLYNKAMAFNPTDEGEAPPEKVETLETVEQPQVETPIVAEAQPSEPKLLDLPEDGLVEVTIDGQKQQISVKDYKDALQREAVWTKRMQTLADQRKQAELEFTNRYAELERRAQAVAQAQQQLQQQNPLNELLKRLEPQQQEKSPNPNEIATIGEVQQALLKQHQQYQQELAAREQDTLKKIAEAQFALQNEQIVQADAVKFTQALESVLGDEVNGILTKVNPNARELIRHKTSLMPAENIEQAIENMKMFVGQWAQSVRSNFVEQQQKVEVNRAKAKLESSTAATPPPAPGNHSKPADFLRKDGKLDWDALRSKAASMMEN